MDSKELSDEIDAMLAAVQARMDAYDERAAMQCDWPTDNQSTTERAMQALERPERFRGEHEVARAWLNHHADRIWTRY